MKHASIWDLSRPLLRSDDPGAAAREHWDVVVIGAGVAGVLTALCLQRDGATVLLVDAGDVAHGVTGQATVKVTSGHGILTGVIVRTHGIDVAIAYQKAQDEGFAQLSHLAAIASDEVGDVDWQVEPHVVHVNTEPAADTGRDAQDLDAAGRVSVQAGSPITRVPGPSWAANDPAWAWENCALVDPAVFVRSLATVFQQRGGTLLLRSPVGSVDRTASGLRIDMGAVTARARHVVMCTNVPIYDPDLLAFRQGYYRHYAIAVQTPDRPATAYGVGPNRASVRPLGLPGGGMGAVVVGGRHRVAETPERDPWANLFSLAQQQLGATGVIAQWSSQDAMPPDYLPYVGRTRRIPDVFVVTGLNSWGFTNSMVAAESVSAAIARGLELELPWRARRSALRSGAKNLGSDLGFAARSEVVDNVRLAARDAAARLMPGEGRVSGSPLKPIAQCRTADGQLHEVSGRCTHAGCVVRWNRWESSWDCPCHGSRFAPDGSVLHGPASAPLEPVHDIAHREVG